MTPSKSTNANGKRPMQHPSDSDGPAIRRGEHLANVRAALNTWRYNTKRTSHTLGSVTAEVVMPNDILTKLATNARLRTVEDIEAAITKPRWIFTRRHGMEVLALLADLDRAERNARERAKWLKAEKVREEREARLAEQKRAKEEIREQKKRDRAAARAQIAAEVAAEKAQKKAEKAEKRRCKQAAEPARPKRPRKSALAGSSVFNTGPSTPISTPHLWVSSL
jgi:hypothetical protein